MHKNKQAHDVLSESEQESLRSILKRIHVLILSKQIKLDFRTILTASSGLPVRPSSIVCIRTALKELENA